jgi:hypothetical protein
MPLWLFFFPMTLVPEIRWHPVAISPCYLCLTPSITYILLWTKTYLPVKSKVAMEHPQLFMMFFPLPSGYVKIAIENGEL